MSDGRKPKSIWRRPEKPKTEAKRDESEKLFYRINKRTGRIDTNLLEWERSWKNVKILKYPTRYANELRLGERIDHDIDRILEANPMLPEVDTAREHWIPTAEQTAELNTINPRVARDARRNEMYLTWRHAQLEENARRKALNEVAKTKIDLEVKDLKEKADTVSKIMGEVLEDMTKTSRDRIEKYRREPADEDDEDVTTLDEARERGDWLFIFYAARETHLYQGAASDPILLYEKQEQEKEHLSKMKHESGDFNRWITKFDDQITACETIGVELTEEAKILYFMTNLNDAIFGGIKANFLDLSTRALFPNTYDGIKQRMIAEYSQLTTRKPQVVMKVIRGEDTRRHGEASFKAEEGGCHICGIPGHFWKKCRNYNSKFSLEQNRDYYLRKKKRGQHEETTDAPSQRAPRGGDDSRGGSGAGGGAGGRGNVIVILRYKLQWPFTTFTARLVLRKTALV